LNETGVLSTNESVPFVYQYGFSTGHKVGRSLQFLSTSSKTNMKANLNFPYYAIYPRFLDYYGNHDYGDKWVLAALDGTETNFSSGLGNADFSQSTFSERARTFDFALF
jgi:hypothetical protein